MTSCEIKDWLEDVNYIVIISGVIWTLIQWPKVRDQRIDADFEKSYAAVNDPFLKFLELQLIYPGHGTDATHRRLVWEELSPIQQDQQRTLFDFLISALERAYYFLDPKKVSHTSEWDSWEHWLKQYAKNPNFVAYWERKEKADNITSYGEKFVNHVKDILEPV